MTDIYKNQTLICALHKIMAGDVIDLKSHPKFKKKSRKGGWQEDPTEYSWQDEWFENPDRQDNATYLRNLAVKYYTQVVREHADYNPKWEVDDAPDYADGVAEIKLYDADGDVVESRDRDFTDIKEEELLNLSDSDIEQMADEDVSEFAKAV
jgi:hypothetical protein